MFKCLVKLCSRHVETNSRFAHEGNTFGLNTIRLQIVCTASRSPQGHPIQTITLFSPFGVASLCTLDGDQQTPTVGTVTCSFFSHLELTQDSFSEAILL